MAKRKPRKPAPRKAKSPKIRDIPVEAMIDSQSTSPIWPLLISAVAAVILAILIFASRHAKGSEPAADCITGGRPVGGRAICSLLDTIPPHAG
jgi:hypothetical protein